jgi:hypothetical protein
MKRHYILVLAILYFGIIISSWALTNSEFVSPVMGSSPESQTRFAGGTGTAADPYQIATPADLNTVRNYLGASNASKCFRLMNNIDLLAYLSSGGAGYAMWPVMAGCRLATVQATFTVLSMAITTASQICAARIMEPITASLATQHPVV